VKNKATLTMVVWRWLTISRKRLPINDNYGFVCSGCVCWWSNFATVSCPVGVNEIARVAERAVRVGPKVVSLRLMWKSTESLKSSNLENGRPYRMCPKLT